MPTLTINELPDALHERLKRAARDNHRSLSTEVIVLLEQALMRRTADERAPDEEERAPDGVERHFGVLDLGHPVGTDNVQIDEDLAKAYSGTS